ncbi:MAG: COX15/CtaA family protein [Woeseiaceae bacterium]|nr:COX15/CtaA family protein [Woeseiaceae bacterium]
MNPSSEVSVSPEQRAVARWLLICCALVFAMVILGGVTRLTGSGLSMADWRPVTGVLPPLSEEAWQRNFELYQQTPEFREKNSHMDVEAFKGIFWLEYLHRLLGRLIGLAFAVPLAFFLLRGYIRWSESPRYFLMLLLGGLQGVLGWYMVRSGLVDNPAVSQYRLTAHLLAAFLIYGFMLWTALSLLRPPDLRERHPWFGRTIALGVLITLTIVSGGFVAGLKAGKLYNTFPMMGDYWVPPGLMALEPAWRNFFENHATVQFDHRVLAITTFFLIVAYWYGMRSTDPSPRLRRGVNALLHTAVLQVALGIATLLLVVPLALAAAHQAVGMLLFTVALYLGNATWGATAPGRVPVPEPV